MNFSFSELVNLDELQSLCEQFTELSGFVTAILDMEGNVLVATGWQEACTRFHRCAPGTALRCRESDTLLANRLRQGEEYSLYRCGNGLIDVAVPIVIDGMQMARLYSGQFLFELPDMEFFRRQAEEFGFDVTSYLDAVRKVPVVTEGRVRQVMGFLCRLAEMIGRMGLANKRIEDANLIIKDNPAVLFRWKTSEGLPIEYVSENVVQFGYTPEELIAGAVPYSSMVYPEDLEKVVSELERYSSNGIGRFQMEYRIVTKGGEIRWVDDRTVAERDADGRLINYRGIVLDITSRRRAEEVLRKNEERMRLFFEHQLVGMAITSTEKGWIQVNKKLCEMLGYSRDELFNLTWAELTHPDDLAADVEHFERLLAGEIDGYNLEKRFIRKDGMMVFTDLSVGCVRTAEGSVDYILALLEDITKRKRAEEALRISERRYRDIVESAPIGIFRSTLEGKFLAANPALARILKYDSLEALLQAVNKKSVGEIHYLEPERRVKIVEKSLPSHEWNIYEEKFRCTDGSVVTANFYHRSVPDAGGDSTEFEGFVEDITERKRAEEALRESEEKFRLLTETSPNAILLCREERVLYANPAAALLSGYTVEEMTRMNFWDFIHGDFREMVRERGLARQRGEPVPSRYECRIVTKSGEDRWVLVSGAPMEYEDTPTSIVVIIDITDAKRAEEALRESEERLRLALSAGNQAFYDIDLRSGTAQGSPEFPIMMDFDPDEHTPTIDYLREQIHPDDRELAFGAYESAVEGVTSDFVVEYRHRTRTGGWKWLLSLGKATERDAEGKARRMLGTVTDISERKKAEERIRSSLAEKTVLLKEIHHRVKNNLQIICALLDLQSDSITDEQSRTCFQYSQDRIRSMALVHEQLYRSRDFASIDFADYIENLASYLFNSYVSDPERISLRVDADSVLLGIDVSIPCGLIVNELVSNSMKHAFPDSREGEIFIGLIADTDGWITLTVADTGVGFPPGIDITNAQTLGLQIVSMLVKQLGGRLEMRNERGASCVVRFRRTVDE